MTRYLYFLMSLLLFVACSDDSDGDEEMTPDTEAPVISNLRWIDSPFYENDPVGDITDGSNYTISIQDGFQLAFSASDQSDIVEGEVYFTVNNDPNIREVLLSTEIILDFKEASFGYYHRVGNISLGAGEFYDLQPGDTYQFYLRVEDEVGLGSIVQWTADLVE